MITPRFSYHLDLLRFVAAFIVLISHYAYPRFTDGYFSIIRDYNLGSDAVVIFFVLSGFVISFAAIEKDKTAGRFAFSRLTRLYSVAVPALLLTLICDKLGFLVDPTIYKAPYYNALPAGEFWLKGLTFSTEWADSKTRLGTNGPYWSLSYEAAYYLLFAILMFSRGVIRVLALTLTVIIVGFKVMLLLPAWAMGAGLYFLLQRLKNYNHSSGILWLMMVVPIMLYVCCLWAGVPHFLYVASHLFMTPEAISNLRFSNEFLWNGLVGAMFSLHLMGAALWMRCHSCAPISSGIVKWLAGASFSLYLVHYPILQITKAMVPTTGIAALDYSILLSVTVAACYLFAEAFERPLYRYRAWLEEALLILKRRASKI